MNIISWNLHKINDMQGRDFAAIAREFVHLRAEPFVFFVLESTGDLYSAKAVGQKIADEMGGGNTMPQVNVLHVGGSKNRAENIIAISRDLKNPQLTIFNDWAELWDQKSTDHQSRRLTLEDERSKNNPYSLRTNQNPTSYGTIYSSGYTMEKIKNDPVPLSDQLRSPALFTCEEGNVKWNIMAVHSPGPRDGKHRGITHADEFFGSLIDKLPRGLDVLIGDFNQYGSTNPGAEMRECPGLGNTTHGKTRVSRLDRIYVRAGIFGRAVTFNKINGKLSDHLGIALVGAGRHVNAMTTVPDDRKGPIVGAGCRTCSAVHGAYPGLLNRWHICTSCKGVYCPGCGFSLEISDWWRTRLCLCGEPTMLVS